MGFTCLEPRYAELSDLVVDAQSAATDDTDAMNEIVRRFDPLAKKLARSMSNCYDTQQDLTNASRIALVAAVRRHDPERAGFPAFARRYMKGGALRELQKWRRRLHADGSYEEARPTLEEDLERMAPSPRSGADQVTTPAAPWGYGTTGEAVAKVKPIQQELLHLRYVEDRALADIAAVTACSAQAVNQRLATAHRAIVASLAA